MITAERLRELLDYDPETGVFTWRQSGRKTKKGAEAGYRRFDGRCMIGLDRSKYMRSVLAVIWMTGELNGEVDHISRDSSDDRWCNLRVCSREQNLRNVGRKKSNTSGYIGVHKRANGRFLSYTRTSEGERIYLGHFSTAEEAAKARDVKAKEQHGEFAVLNFE